MRAIATWLLVASMACAVEPAERCSADAAITVTMDAVPPFLAADVTLYGRVSRDGRFPIDLLFIDDIAATSTSGNFDTFSVAIPRGRLLELRRDDGSVPLTARVLASSSCATATVSLPVLQIVLGPPQLLPATGTLLLNTPFSVVVRFDAAFDTVQHARHCWWTPESGIAIVHDGVPAGQDALTSVAPASDGQIHFTITANQASAQAPIQVTCVDQLAQAVTGTYTPFKTTSSIAGERPER